MGGCSGRGADASYFSKSLDGDLEPQTRERSRTRAPEHSIPADYENRVLARRQAGCQVPRCTCVCLYVLHQHCCASTHPVVKTYARARERAHLFTKTSHSGVADAHAHARRLGAMSTSTPSRINSSRSSNTHTHTYSIKQHIKCSRPVSQASNELACGKGVGVVTKTHTALG